MYSFEDNTNEMYSSQALTQTITVILIITSTNITTKTREICI